MSKESIDLAKETYKNIPNTNFFNIGISDNENQDKLEIFYADDIKSPHLSYRKCHHSDHNNRHPVYSFYINCMSLNKFIETNNIDPLDILYIDTEGLDCNIVLSIDLDKYNIKKIQFEHMHSEKSFDDGNSFTYTQVCKKLKEAGYRIEKIDGDTIAVKL